MNENHLSITLKILENASLSSQEISIITGNFREQLDKGALTKEEYQVIQKKLEQMNVKLHIMGSKYKKRSRRA